MKDRIKFSDEMLAAVIAGRKTQTRRLIEPQPSAGTEVSVVSKTFPYKLTGGTIPFADRDGCEKGMLKVISVHIHSIHDISTADAIAEGFDKKSPRHSFMQEWINIYGAHNWIENPWVWVIEFHKIK